MITGDFQIGILTAENDLSSGGRCVIDHITAEGPVVVPENSTGNSTVSDRTVESDNSRSSSGQLDLRSIVLNILDPGFAIDSHTVPEVVRTGDHKAVVDTAEDRRILAVSHSTVVGHGRNQIVITEDGRSFSVGCTVEFDIGIAGDDAAITDISQTGNLEVFHQHVITVDGQTAVGSGVSAAVDIGSGLVGHGRTASTGDDTGVVGLIGIGLTVEGHLLTGSNILSAADVGGILDIEAVGKGTGGLIGKSFETEC